MDLLENHGLSAEQIATKMHLGLPRVARLIEEEEQVRDLQRYKLDTFPVSQLKELYDCRLEENPTLTQAGIARSAKMARINLRRAIGESPAATRVLNGERQPGEMLSEVSVETAARIVRALGIAPREIPGL